MIINPREWRAAHSTPNGEYHNATLRLLIRVVADVNGVTVTGDHGQASVVAWMPCRTEKVYSVVDTAQTEFLDTFHCIVA